MAVQLSVKAKENLERIAESRKKDSKFVRVEPGEKTTLHFDAEKIEPVEVEFEGKKSLQPPVNVSNNQSLLLRINSCFAHKSFDCMI